VTTHASSVLPRKLAVAGGLLALAVPALSSCGFDYATDRPNEILHGGTSLNAEGPRVNAARIVSGSEGTGTFIATFTVNPQDDTAAGAEKNPAFVGLQTAPGAEDTVQAPGNLSVEIGSTGSLNLADPAEGGIPVTGDFVPGDSIPMEISFDDGSEPIRVQVPVVTQCGPYADVVARGQGGRSQGQGGSGQASGQASEGASASASAGHSEEPSAEHSAAASEQPSAGHAEEESASEHGSAASGEEHAAGSSDPYSCEFPPAELPSSEH